MSMRSRAGLMAAMIALVGAAGAPSAAGRPVTAPGTIGAVPVVTGLNFPAAFTFAPDGRIFYGERLTGEIHIYDPSNSSDTLFFTINKLAHFGEQGLLGLALHPSYPGKPFVYAYATRAVGGSEKDQIIAIRDSGGTGRRPKIIWSSDTVAGDYHDG